MKHQDIEGEWFEDKWVFIIGVSLIGLIYPCLAGIFLHRSLIYIIADILISTISTSILWLGCRSIIIIISKIYPWERKPIKHLFSALIAIPAYNLLVIQLLYMTLGNISWIMAIIETGFWENVLFSMAVCLIITFIHEGIYFFLQWKSSLLRAQKLENENVISRFETLKSQVNPHFLFNSFNTLLTIIDEDKNAAIHYVESLSDFYRILLKFRDRTLISLSDELHLVDIYFFLQTKRYGANISLEIDVPDEQRKLFIPPLSLQMLVENAIKHNIISTDKNLKITIKALSANKLEVTNNLQKRMETLVSGGVGLENIRKRFLYLCGIMPEISVTSFTFTVVLPLIQSIEDENPDN